MIESNHEYKGNEKRLVLAFDVGTTFSGVSYCFLEPGMVAKTHSVSRYPGQEHAPDLAKIPTVLYYDQTGTVRAAGAEATQVETVEQAEEGQWQKVEWFKMRVCPASMDQTVRLSNLPPLPSNKTISVVFGDFLSYLMSCAERFIRESDASLKDEKAWIKLHRSAIFILGHPNGWEGSQQAILRKAAVHACLVPDTLQGRSRLKLVTEGEASLNFCLRSGNVKPDLGDGFIIADLGGGTLDFSAYRLTSEKPVKVREVASSKCDLEGSTLVSLRAKAFIQEDLKRSRYGKPETIDLIVECFDAKTKKTFSGLDEGRRLVRFGSPTDNDRKHNIHAGKLSLRADTMVSFFEPALQAAVKSIRAQILKSSTSIRFVYLVGGFSASPYLSRSLEERLAEDGVKVILLDGQAEKAVAAGAVAHFDDHCVTHRIAKYTYGTFCGVDYVSSDPEHFERRHLLWTAPSGRVLVDGAFRTILRKDTSVLSKKVFKREFGCERKPNMLRRVQGLSVEVFQYVGAEDPPLWRDQINDKSMLRHVCTITGDASVTEDFELHVAKSGKQYFWLNHSVNIDVGAPEMTAYISWIGKDGTQRKSPAEIIYDEEQLEEEEDPEPNFVDVPAVSSDRQVRRYKSVYNWLPYLQGK